MSKIIQLDPSYNLWLSYTWSNNNHGICGHTFEVFDYYYILKDHFKVGIFLGEDIDWDIVERAIRAKYAFTDGEVSDIKSNTVFGNRPSLLKGKNILFTDGGVVNMENVTLLFDNILYFACGNKEIKDNSKSNVWILQDDRVYEPVKLNGINYKKRILFDKLKPIGASKDRVMLYATKNCRDIDDWEVYKKYGDNILAITNEENRPTDIAGFEFVIPPVADIFEQFTTYVYTPVKRKWDCSPRFIAECKYYGKQVVYHNIDYWGIDHGLYYRYLDIQNDFDSLYLKPDDEIISIIKGII
jgi:hypothetical protein